MARTPDEVREAKRLHMARKRAADIETARAYGREYHHRNRAQNCAKLREYHAKRFFWARAKKCLGSVTEARALARIWKSQRGLCALTGRRLDRSAQIDHIIPKARGGADEIGNLRWVCPEVNYAKRDLTDEQLLAMCGDVMRWIGERIEAVNQLVTSQ